MEKENLTQTITIRASEVYKDKLYKLAKDASQQLSGEVKITDLVRLGLDWVSAHKPDEIVAFLVREKELILRK